MRGGPVPLRDGEVLLAHVPPSVMLSVGPALGLLPGGFAAVSLALNLAGQGIPMPWWGIALGAASSVVILGGQYLVGRRSIESIVLTPDGCHARITNIRPLNVLPATEAVVPLPFLRHRHDVSDGTMKLRVAAPGTDEDSITELFLSLDSTATVADRAALEEFLAGKAPIAIVERPADPDVAFWRRASAPDGRTYWYNEVTRRRQWDRPEGVPEDQE